MEERRFDDLTRAIAQSTSRRRMLKGLVAAVAGGALASLGLGAQAKGNSDAAHFCNTVFPPGPDRGKCTSDAAHGTGLYYQCQSNPSNICQDSNGVSCPDFSSDANHCGTCENPCPPGQPCIDGTCGCLSNQTSCGGNCVDNCDAATGEVLDPITCQCGCPLNQVLCNGSCVETCEPTSGETLDPTTCECGCPSDQELCGGVCIDLCDPATGEVHNPDTCACECPNNHTICNGTCVSLCDSFFGQVMDPTTCQCACPEGYVMLGNGFCLRGCTTDDDCGDFRTCDTTTEGDRVCSSGGYLPFCSPCTSTQGCQSGPGSCFAVNTYCSAIDHLCH